MLYNKFWIFSKYTNIRIHLSKLVATLNIITFKGMVHMNSMLVPIDVFVD